MAGCLEFFDYGNSVLSSRKIHKNLGVSLKRVVTKNLGGKNQFEANLDLGEIKSQLVPLDAYCNSKGNSVWPNTDYNRDLIRITMGVQRHHIEI